ncbi:paraneoplastic antigen Ma1 homolog [Polypterus senegalus]|uniref:paraneoplastic antigen Ma1 homolog n=1 Tax=Polypterus senegalus TaxID=55291 RepID=UPI0019633C16|nr:paraneoplastic antigen Ma1 homolog [Polypterus senegalus]
MATQKEFQLQAKFSSWCREANIEPLHAFVLCGVPTETKMSDIKEAAPSVKIFGRVKVRDIQTDAETGSNRVLCECRYKVDSDRIPMYLQPLNGDLKWKVVLLSDTVDDFSAKLHQLLKDEGKTVSDVHALLSTDAPQASSPESIIKAVGDLLGKTLRPTYENNAFRCLCMFSGNQPIPGGKENLEQWLEQARLMIEESDCSDREKRKKIVESLKGPALDIIQAVQLSDPDASPIDYVDALESAFGSPESGEDLYFAFRSLYQQSKERLSDFLRKLEHLLIKVVKKGGLSGSRADRARIDQLIRGATESDMMLVQLRLRERREKPPTFLMLLCEIREEEEFEMA